MFRFGFHWMPIRRRKVVSAQDFEIPFDVNLIDFTAIELKYNLCNIIFKRDGRYQKVSETDKGNL